MKLTCPIRGELSIQVHAKDGLTFTEEKRRIELINFLMNKKNYLKSDIELEYPMKVGSGGRLLRVDLVIKKNENFLIVAEVKRDPKNKEDGINHQLKPAFLTLKAEFGIYWDGVENDLLMENDRREFETLSVSKLPKKGTNFGAIKIILDDLEPILDSKTFFNNLNLLVHNLQISKEQRYKGIFQIILSKYYDEKMNQNDIKFTSNIEDEEVYDDILWKKTTKYYEKFMNKYTNKKLIFKWDTIKLIIRYMEDWSFIKSTSSTIQDFFMEFGSKILQADLGQFYTPIPIINFIINSLNIKTDDFIIDPAGGSADFLTGIIQKYKNDKEYCDIKDNLNYWDNSEQAIEVAYLNMILNGDGKTNISEIDSIKEWDKDNLKYDFVITNPPFGQKVVWEGDLSIMDNYELAKFAKNKKQHLGILFIERSMNLLSNNGILAIILPSGYLNNPTSNFIRNYLIENYKIIADISFPEGTFKGSGTGVKTDLLYVQKTKYNENYKIFMDVVYKLGFDYKKKELPNLYQVDNKTGVFKLDSKNQKILDSDLDLCLEKLKSFAYDQNVEKLEKRNPSENNYETPYDFVYSNELDISKKIKPELYQSKFLNAFNFNNAISLADYNNVIISKKTPDLNIVNDKIYRYVDIGRSSKGLYNLDNKIYGWEVIKINRAKQMATRCHIYISYLLGSMNSFFLFDEKRDDVIITNGMYSIFIPDERLRLSFYKFLFTKNYNNQFEAYSTGHIMTNISSSDILNFKFQMLDDKELEKFKKMIESTNTFLKLTHT